MPVFQRNLHVAVLRTDQAGVVVRHVEAADRHADVVGNRRKLVGGNNLANGLLDFGDGARAFLDPRADFAADVHQDLPGIDGGKEVLSEIGDEQERGADAGEKRRHENTPVAHDVG